jgi:hypothetical protein
MQNLWAAHNKLYHLSTAWLLSASCLLGSTSALAVTFSNPDDLSGSPPTDTNGGATRQISDQCAAARNAAISITPTPSNRHPALTVAAHPTFFVYVPPTTATTATFSLQNNQREIHYQSSISLPKTGGILSVELPKSAPPLEVGKTYKWYVEIHCSSAFDPDNPIVESAIERTVPSEDLTHQLNHSQTPIEQASAYSKSYIWYETLGTLATARKISPDDEMLAQNWQELLTSVGLGSLASQPLLTQYSLAALEQ